MQRREAGSTSGMWQLFQTEEIRRAMNSPLPDRISQRRGGFPSLLQLPAVVTGMCLTRFFPGEVVPAPVCCRKNCCSLLVVC